MTTNKHNNIISNKHYYILTLFLIMPLLAGCSNTQGSWSCAEMFGSSCLSAKDVDKKIASDKKRVNPPNIPQYASAGDTKSPMRTNDETRTIHIKPYIDSDGNLYDETKIHIVVRNAEWKY